jgi:prepilin-type processing-associated H-X9-DG protein
MAASVTVANAVGNMGRSNYFANMGATAAQYFNTGLTSLDEKNPAVVGIFNYRIDSTQPQYLDTAKTQVNPLYQQCPGTKIAEITDGTSNTAMFAEVKRSNLANGGSSANTSDVNDTVSNVYTIASASFNLYSPVLPNCNTPGTSRIGYRGEQYYRILVETTNYSHTVPPNYTGSDCGDTAFVAAHIAARSFHPGGVNVSFCDGSVRFIKSSTNLTVWRALGTRAGGEVVSSDAY